MLRIDIDHPTDNTLLWDVVRVVTRLTSRLATALGRRRIKGSGIGRRRGLQLVRKMGRTSASAFLEALIAAVPYKIHTVLTDNEIQFTFPPVMRTAR